MVSQLKRQVLAVVLSVLCLTEQAATITCKGASSAIQGYGATCVTDSEKAVVAENQSCMKAELADVTKTCVAASCTSVNVQIKPGMFSDTDNKIWSVAGCYNANLVYKFCSAEPTVTTAGPTVTTTTTTAPTTTTTTTKKPTTTTATTESTTTESTTTESATTTESTTSDTTTTGMTTTTTAAPTTTTTTAGPTTTKPLVKFDGCISGTAVLPAACAKASAVELSAAYTKTGETTSTSVTILTTIVGCCDEDNCEVDDQVTRDYSCLFKNGDGKTGDAECKVGCFAARKGSTVYRGCLADMPLEGTSFAANILDCSSADAECPNASGAEEMCLRCCKSGKCNTWTTKNEFLGIKDDGGNGAPLSLCSSIVLVTTLLLSHVF